MSSHHNRRQRATAWPLDWRKKGEVSGRGLLPVRQSARLAVPRPRQWTCRHRCCAYCKPNRPSTKSARSSRWRFGCASAAKPASPAARRKSTCRGPWIFCAKKRSCATWPIKRRRRGRLPQGVLELGREGWPPIPSSAWSETTSCAPGTSSRISAFAPTMFFKGKLACSRTAAPTNARVAEIFGPRPGREEGIADMSSNPATMKVGYFPGCFAARVVARFRPESLHAVAKALSIELLKCPSGTAAAPARGT